MGATPESSPEATETLAAEIDARLVLLERARPKSLDGFAVCSTSELPSKVLAFCEALLWRTAQLGRSAFESFKNNKLASAILLTRATVEACAALWYLHTKLDTVVQSRALGNIDDVMKLLIDGRIDVDILPTAIKYDRLSEFAHPNWAGTALLFSKIEAGGITNFGENIHGIESPTRVGLANLSVALAIFELRYNQITDLMPVFVSVCKQHSAAE